ncbi:hypothetical protein M9H77_27280 [Catharanthus roseus]|uniref:Uncharacterized protein n=1 Tax=Catharanthus roseus TaxID=4058 RepID=A0ACC0AER8_CATRO|nr:hypothetical protein M9H77_27280 [Catharanthus roseus]
MHVNCRQAGQKCREMMILVLSRTGQVEFRGHTVTALSRGVRGRHSTSDLPSTPTPLPFGLHYDTRAPESSTQPPTVPFRSRPHIPSHLSHTSVPYEAYRSAHPHPQPPPIVYDLYLATPTEDQRADDGGDSNDDDDDGEDVMSKISGSRNKRPDKAHDVLTPTQKKTMKGGPFDPELIPLYGGHLVAVIQGNLGLGFIGGGINSQELFDVAIYSRSTLSRSDRAAYYIQYLLGSSLFTDKSGNIVPSRLWPLVKDESWYGLTRRCKGLIGYWSLLEVLFIDFRRFEIVGFPHGTASLHTSTLLTRICLTGSLDNSGLGNVFPHTLFDSRRHASLPTTGCTL